MNSTQSRDIFAFIQLVMAGSGMLGIIIMHSCKGAYCIIDYISVYIIYDCIYTNLYDVSYKTPNISAALISDMQTKLASHALSHAYVPSGVNYDALATL